MEGVGFPPTGPPDLTKWQARGSRGQNIRRGKGICSGEGRPTVRLPQVPPEVHFRAGNATSCWIAQTPSPVTAPPPPGSHAPNDRTHVHHPLNEHHRTQPQSEWYQCPVKTDYNPDCTKLFSPAGELQRQKDDSHHAVIVGVILLCAAAVWLLCLAVFSGECCECLCGLFKQKPSPQLAAVVTRQRSRREQMATSPGRQLARVAALVRGQPTVVVAGAPVPQAALAGSTVVQGEVIEAQPVVVGELEVGELPSPGQASQV